MEVMAEKAEMVMHANTHNELTILGLINAYLSFTPSDFISTLIQRSFTVNPASRLQYKRKTAPILGTAPIDMDI